MGAVRAAAELDDLLITASLLIIFFQLLHNKLLYGQGLLLRSIGAGFDFAKLSFFGRRDFREATRPCLGAVRGIERFNQGYF